MQRREGQIVNVVAFLDTIEFMDQWTRIKTQ
jgi:hypothetical protein